MSCIYTSSFINSLDKDELTKQYISILKKHETGIKPTFFTSEKSFIFFKDKISTFLHSYLSNKTFKCVRLVVAQWENGFIDIYNPKCVILPDYLVALYTALKEAMLELIPNYSQNLSEIHYIIDELERLEIKIEKYILDYYKKILKENFQINNNKIGK